MSKSYKYWTSWRTFYGNIGFAGAGEQIHHSLWRRYGAKFGTGYGWRLKNMPWNLITMQDSRLLGLTGNQIHTLVHGGTIRATGLTWKNSLIGTGLRVHYGTNTFFKTTVNYTIGRGTNSTRE